MHLIPQSVNYLDPLMRVGNQVRTSVKGGDAIVAQRDVFERLHLKSDVENMYPFQLSGGMARRTLLSTAIVSGAKVIIADEPTPGLDPVVIKEALSNFREFADKGCAVMLITHDIESALTIADKIAVFYAGTTVEIASVEDFVGDGEHCGILIVRRYGERCRKMISSRFRVHNPIRALYHQVAHLNHAVPRRRLNVGQTQPEIRNFGMEVRCIHAT